jgi:hypothetical protein
LRHEVFAHGDGFDRRLEYAATPTWQGQDATARPGDMTIRVALVAIQRSRLGEADNFLVFADLYRVRGK